MNPVAAPPADDDLSPAERLRIDALCLQFEAIWRAGQTPGLEPYLTGIDEPLRPHLIGELVRIDREWRRRSG